MTEETVDRSGTYFTRDNRVAIVTEDRFQEFTGYIYVDLSKNKGHSIYMHWDKDGKAMNGDKEMDLML